MLNISALLNAHRVFHRAHPVICKLLHKGVAGLANKGIEMGKKGIEILGGDQKGIRIWKDEAGKRYFYKQGYREYLD